MLAECGVPDMAVPSNGVTCDVRTLSDGDHKHVCGSTGRAECNDWQEAMQQEGEDGIRYSDSRCAPLGLFEAFGILAGDVHVHRSEPEDNICAM